MCVRSFMSPWCERLCGVSNHRCLVFVSPDFFELLENVWGIQERATSSYGAELVRTLRTLLFLRIHPKKQDASLCLSLSYSICPLSRGKFSLVLIPKPSKIALTIRYSVSAYLVRWATYCWGISAVLPVAGMILANDLGAM